MKKKIYLSLLFFALIGMGGLYASQSPERPTVPTHYNSANNPSGGGGGGLYDAPIDGGAILLLFALGGALGIRKNNEIK